MTKVLVASAPSVMKIMVVSPPDGEIFTVGAGSFPLRESLVQCETYELLDGEITTVGTKTLPLRGGIVPTKHPATSSRSRATWNATSTSASIWSSMSCPQAEYVPGGCCEGVSSIGDEGQVGYSI